MPLWNNNSGDWQTGANWFGGVPANGFGHTADFVNQSNGGFMQVGILQGAPITLGTLNVTLTGTTDMVIRGSANDVGTAPARLRFESVSNPNLDPQAFVNINTAVGGGEFEISGFGGLEVELFYQTIFNVVTAGTTARLNAPLASGATGGLVKDGAGTLSIGSDNTAYTGTFTVTEGILHVLNPSGFGSGVTILQTGGILKSQGSVDNSIHLTNGNGGIQAATGATLTLTGGLTNQSAGILTLGNATDNGTIVLNNVAIQNTAGTHAYRLGGGTVRLENAAVAINMFNNSGTGLLEISTGATLDTRGFDARLTNLDMDGGTLRSSNGILDVWITDRATSLNTQTGTVFGTAGADQFWVDAVNGYSLAGLTFSGWTNGTDDILIRGNANTNNLTGSTQKDRIFGFDGNDILSGNGGPDEISGGNGNDTIILNAANTGSYVYGESGIDTLQITSGPVQLGAGSGGFEAIQLVGGSTLHLSNAQFNSAFAIGTTIAGTGTLIVDMSLNETFKGTQMSVVAGSSIATTINGNNSAVGTDIIKGITGATNIIFANAGNDQVRGGALHDEIHGGDGDDKIGGGQGADWIWGGAGADTFRYPSAAVSGTGANADTIFDFVSGTDKLSFLALDADPIAPGQQGLTYVGNGAFTATGAAEIRWQDTGADLRVDIDVDGNGTADMQIFLAGAGAGTLVAGDFLL